MSQHDEYEIKTRVTMLEDISVAQQGDDCFVVIYAPNPRDYGQRFLLQRDSLTIGRDRDNDIVLDSDSVSRRHCRVERRGDHHVLVDLDSTNGTFINDGPGITEIQLRRGDQVKIGDTIFKYLSGSDVESQYHETIHHIVVTDGLTGVSTKRFLLEELQREIPRALRHERNLSLLMMDIDHFKRVNDTYGHLAGDTVLKDLAAVLRNRLRPDDVLGRYGGEEFLAILPETSLQGAVEIAEQLRRVVEQQRFEAEDDVVRVTMSIGAAELKPDLGIEELIEAADAKAYEAKRAGRNCVKS